MARLACLAATLVLSLNAPSAAQDARPTYDFRGRIHALAFDPARFFPNRFRPAISIRYQGDDYGYPVYAIAVHKGCTDADLGEALRTCGKRLMARMVRAPYVGEPSRPRMRGQRLFAAIGRLQPQSEDDLLRTLDGAGLEWLEADIRDCPDAMAHLATGRDLKFSTEIDQIDRPLDIVLHADTVLLEIGGYLTRSRYEGWLKPGSPGVWAIDLATSLEACWKPSTALVPWRAANY